MTMGKDLASNEGQTMLYGNITLSSRPDEDELRSGVICGSCLEECEETGVDDSFDDAFGNVTCWGVGSSCCGSECFEGAIFLDRCRDYTARKDHLDSEGNVKIAKGQRYRSTIKKGYYIEDGEHKGIYEYSKKPIKAA
jgi:hypothetical protein